MGESELDRPEPRVQASSVDVAPSFWARVKEHKLLQWTLAYAGAALAIAHGQELMATAFGWSHAVGRVVVALLVLGLPLVVTLAWYHGHKGLKQVGAGELMIVSVLLVVLGGGFFLLVRAPEDGDGSAAHATEVSPAASRSGDDGPIRPTSAKPRIAIMPFENLSPDPDNAFFTDGTHEQILSTLASRAPGLDVISRTTMMSYRGRPVTVQEVSAALGATHVLEGSVRREGEQVRVTLQLVDARADRHLWSRDYNRVLTNALTLQSEIGGEVASQLSVELTSGGERSVLPPTRDPEAYDLYLKSRLTYFSGPNQPLANLEAMVKLLDEAIARDPDFVRAYVERMRVHRLFFEGNHDASERRLELVRSDLDTAVGLAPGDPAVVGAQGTWNCLNENYDEALQQFATAQAAGFSEADLDHARCLLTLGRYNEARALYERAMALDPRNPGPLAAYASSALRANRPMDTVRALSLGMARMPNQREWPLLHGVLLLRFAGKSDELSSVSTEGRGTAASPSPFDDDTYLIVGYESLILQKHYQEAWRLLDDSPDLVRWAEGIVRYVGKTPVARFRGWVDLLLEDEGAAIRDGRALLEFVGEQETTRWNGWYLRILEAEGRLFTGDLPGARESAGEALELTSQSRNLLYRAGAQSMAATVLAWAGAEEEAAGLLESVANSSPGVAPAQVTRNPTLSIPLANNARYRALSARLEAQMAALDLE